MFKLTDLLSKKKIVEDDGILHIDCKGCENKLNLGSKCCMKCLCDHAGNGEYTEISFISGLETRYKEESSRIFIEFAHIVNAIAQDTESKCDGCQLSGKSIREQILSDISPENINYIETRVGTTFVECEKCADCVSYRKASIEKFSTELKGLMNDSLITAFKLVGA